MSHGRPTYQTLEHPELFSPEELGERPLVDADCAVPPLAEPQEEPIRFMSIGSGSSGNCAYVGDSRSGFLIDAGIDADKVASALKGEGISMAHVKGIILTHDHSDHVRYVYALLRNNRHMLVYCTPKVLNGMLRRHSLSRRVKDYHRAIYKEFEFSIGNFVITPFEVMHDGTDNCGFHLRHGRATMVVATDLGCISERVEHYFTGVNFMMVESNYDREMLRTGRYPDYLKARIERDNGHLDNTVSAELVARKYHPGLTDVFLCHLSNDNNTPQLALEAHRAEMERVHPEVRIGDSRRANLCDVRLEALPRYDATPLRLLRPRLV